MEIKRFIDTLAAAGWNIVPAGTKIAPSNPRLKRAPEDLRKFVEMFDVLADQEDTTL